MAGIPEVLMCEGVPIASPITGIVKRCVKCGEPKELTEFHKNRRTVDGCYTYCKVCSLKDHSRDYRKNPDKKRAYNRAYYLLNREKLIVHQKTMYKNKKEIKSVYNKIYRMKNIEKIRDYTNKYIKNKLKTNPLYRLNEYIRGNIRKSLKNGTKNRQHWEELVGFTLSQLKLHLEKNFSPGMTWDNYGEWHIDHIIPISAFNFETCKDLDFRKCWNLKNLQPLWAIENISKRAKLNKPFQQSLLIEG